MNANSERIAVSSKTAGKKSTPMLMLVFICLLPTVFLPARSTHAQHPVKNPKIGFLFVSSLSANSARANAFRQGLRDLGYIEGKNIIIEWRSADGRPDRLPAIASELVHLDWTLP